jgi:DNA-binding transcriptional LysR family regulator
MEGSGIALADVEMFTREIADGRLVAPYAEEYENGYGYYLTMAAEDLEDPAIAAFRNWIIARLARRRTIKT